MSASASADRRNPLSRRLPINRGRDLSRKFFEEGERQQEAGWENSPLAAETSTAEPALAFRSFDHVPRRRAPLIAAATIVFVGVGVLAAAGSGWWSPRVLRKADIGLTLFLLGAGSAPGAVSPPAATPPLALAPPATSSSIPAMPGRPVSPPSIVSLPAPSTTPVTMAPGMRATTATPSDAGHPPTARRSLVPSRRKASKTGQPRQGTPSRARQKQATALEGYVGSPDREQLVSSESAPVPVETREAEPETAEPAASETF